MKIFVGVITLLILFGGVWLFKAPQGDDPEVIATRGIHWHPHLEIYVKGEKQDIPADLGVGPQYAGMPTFDPAMRMTAVHTHEPDGTIHFEFPARVTREDTKLGNFFRIWNKDFRAFGRTVVMTVNGEENAELDEYEMKDGDKIVLRYE